MWIERPIKTPLAMFCFIILPRPSAIRIKRKGERGPPCTIPLEEVNGAEGDPLIRMEK